MRLFILSRGVNYITFRYACVIYVSYQQVSFASYLPIMQAFKKEKEIAFLHSQMISNEKLYQQALKSDEQFKVLKGFKNIMKELRSKLEIKLLSR